MTQVLDAPQAISRAAQEAAPVVPPALPALRFPRQGEWTYDDWLKFPIDGWKYEIIDGVLHMSPPPLIDHQAILGALFARMWAHARRQGLGQVLCAPCGVRLPGQRVPVEPDILFVRRERLSILADRYVEGAPDLVVEILSPSNAAYDLETKYALYERAGVAEYWIVNPWEKQVRILRLAEARDQLVGAYGPGRRARSEVLTGFGIRINELFDVVAGA